MNYEKFGICITVIIVACLMGAAGIASGEFGIELAQGDQKYNIPFPTSSTKADSNSSYFEWCYKMKFEC